TGEELDVAQLLADELAALDPQAALVLELVCIAGTPIRQQVIFTAAGLRPDRALVDQLRRRRLIHGQHDATDAYVEVYHGRVREVALASIDPDERRELHLRLANALEEAGVADAETLARHYREARV